MGDRRQFGFARVDNEHGQELHRLGIASIGADAVAIAGHFEEVFARLVGHDRTVVHLASYRAFEHGRLDECRFPMRVSG